MVESLLKGSKVLWEEEKFALFPTEFSRDWLIDWLNVVLHLFQQYFSLITASAHIIHVFPGFHQYKTGALKCLVQGSLDDESNTLPLSQVEPLKRLVPQNDKITGLFAKGLTPYHTLIPTFNDPRESSLLKILWEKEKMLVTSIFCFSHNVFYSFQSIS